MLKNWPNFSYFPKTKDFDYVNFIYKADLTDKTIENKEPYKCAELKFFPLDNFPKPMDDYIKMIIQKSYDEPLWIYENGW